MVSVVRVVLRTACAAGASTASVTAMTATPTISPGLRRCDGQQRRRDREHHQTRLTSCGVHPCPLFKKETCWNEESTRLIRRAADLGSFRRDDGQRRRYQVRLSEVGTTTVDWPGESSPMAMRGESKSSWPAVGPERQIRSSLAVACGWPFVSIAGCVAIILCAWPARADGKPSGDRPAPGVGLVLRALHFRDDVSDDFGRMVAVDPDTGECRRVYSVATLGHLSPDGRQIVYWKRSGDDPQEPLGIYVQDTEGDAPPRLILRREPERPGSEWLTWKARPSGNCPSSYRLPLRW